MAPKKKGKSSKAAPSPLIPSGSLQTFPLTIAAGQSLSPALSLSYGVVVFVIMPPQWDAAARVISFQASADGTNYYDVFNSDGQENVCTVTPGVGYDVTGVNNWAGYMKIRSGSRDNPVAQSVARTFNLVLMVP